VPAVVHLIGHMRLGAGRHIVETAREQRRRGWWVQVMVSPDVDSHWRTDPEMVRELELASIPVNCIGDFFSRNLAELRAAAGALAKAWEDSSIAPIAHAHSAIPGVVARWAGAEKVITTCHGVALERDGAFDLQDAIAFRLADTVISPSRYWSERLEKFYSVPQIHILPYGMDLRRRPPLRVQDRPASTPMRVLILSELTRRKGIDILLEAARQLARKRETMELHIFGSGESEDTFRMQAAAIPNADRWISFHGRVEAPYERLAEFDLLCLPTRSDNQPLAIIEAMLAGLPILSTRVGGIPEMVEPSGCGFVVPPDSPEALADGLLACMNMGGDTLREMGRKGCEYARSRFDIRASVDALEAVYNVPIAARRP